MKESVNPLAGQSIEEEEGGEREKKVREGKRRKRGNLGK